jgi:dolichyl-phosphate-mannose-protein mannosyltransferase
MESGAVGGRLNTVSPVPDSVRRRLESMPAWTWPSWCAALWVVVIAGILRFVHLGLPNSLVFDEVYYANDAQDLLAHGVEWRTVTDPAGNVTASYADFVVHPPLGKWIILAGIKLFDGGWARSLGSDQAYGWRFSGAVCGVLAVLMITRIGRRLFRSTVLGATAGLLMALDGFQLVLSRTAILDIFVLFFSLAAFGCLVLDRDSRRRRWLTAMESGAVGGRVKMENGLDPGQGGRAGRPELTWAGVPWWRLGAGVMLGAGCAVKWSVVWYIPVFMALAYVWEAQLRKTVGVTRPWRDALIDEGGWLLAMGGLAAATYLASWTGWFVTDDGWKRHYLRDQLGGHEYPVIGALYNLFKYHQEVLTFHDGLNSPHPFQSWPWQWLILGRPVAFYLNSDPICGQPNCVGEILLLGTPALWWAFLPALGATLWFGIARRDWRAAPILVGAAAGIVPWFPYEWDDRTMFYFYAAPAEPFLILSVVYVLGCLATSPAASLVGQARTRLYLGLTLSPAERKQYGIIGATGFVLLVALCFWYYYPLYVGNSIPNADWANRLLLGNRWR